MRINGAIQPTENLQTQNVDRRGNSASPGTTGPVTTNQDQAQLSGDAGKAVQFKAALAQVPDVRQERVQSLQQAVGSGNYRVSNQQLADAIGQDPLSKG